MNGPGSRQEIATYKSAGTRLASEGVHVWGGAASTVSSPGWQNSRIKVVLTFQSS